MLAHQGTRRNPTSGSVGNREFAKKFLETLVKSAGFLALPSEGGNAQKEKEEG
jgi:hypothetical protein